MHGLALWELLGPNPREREARVFRPRRELSRRSLPSPVQRAARRQTGCCPRLRSCTRTGASWRTTGASFRSEAIDYLYRAASEAPSWPSWVGSLSPTAGDLNSFALELQKPRGRAAAQRNAVRYVLNAVRHRRSDARDANSSRSSPKKERRKRRARPGSGRTEPKAMLGEPEKNRSRSAWRAWLKPRELAVGAARRNARGGSSARLSLHGVALAPHGIPPKIRDKHWTVRNALMFRTLKYVCDLWALKKPQIGPECGFSVR
ncbi:hypothetical protein Q5P01_021936 [Channa striata]|uniref:Uncharacterized protein n=1 Tax=Channa striata TaxID=64152 RepID=A0AA88IYR2_CHASR|nr:hypothetical protein Q5P01_021936 [Channa striata]